MVVSSPTWVGRLDYRIGIALEVCVAKPSSASTDLHAARPTCAPTHPRTHAASLPLRPRALQPHPQTTAPPPALPRCSESPSIPSPSVGPIPGPALRIKCAILVLPSCATSSLVLFATPLAINTSVADRLDNLVASSAYHQAPSLPSHTDCNYESRLSSPCYRRTSGRSQPAPE